MADEREAAGIRPHTGRRRNEAARRAILDAALELVGSWDGGPVTVETIAARAGVGKQTIYRWWPSKYAVLADALAERARSAVPVPDTGSLAGDLTAFLTSTFRGGRSAPAPLRAVMAAALRDPHAAAMLHEFTAERRRVLREVIGRGRSRGELAAGADVDLLVDQAFGLYWYRLLTDHGALSDGQAAALAAGLAAQAAAGH